MILIKPREFVSSIHFRRPAPSRWQPKLESLILSGPMYRPGAGPIYSDGGPLYGDPANCECCIGDEGGALGACGTVPASCTLTVGGFSGACGGACLNGARTLTSGHIAELACAHKGWTLFCEADGYWYVQTDDNAFCIDNGCACIAQALYKKNVRTISAIGTYSPVDIKPTSLCAAAVSDACYLEFLASTAVIS